MNNNSCNVSSDVDNNKTTVKVMIDGKSFTFNDKWISKPHSMNMNRNQTQYKRPENLSMLVKGYKICRERILLLRLVETVFNINKSITENKTKIIDLIGIEYLSDNELKSIDIILDEVRHVVYVKGHRNLMLSTMDELNLYQYNNKVFGVVEHPFRLGTYLPKVKFDNMYIINNLLSRCQSIDETDVTQWLVKYNR